MSEKKVVFKHYENIQDMSNNDSPSSALEMAVVYYKSAQTAGKLDTLLRIQCGAHYGIFFTGQHRVVEAITDALQRAHEAEEKREIKKEEEQ